MRQPELACDEGCAGSAEWAGYDRITKTQFCR
jgi:hypothetical protein